MDLLQKIDQLIRMGRVFFPLVFKNTMKGFEPLINLFGNTMGTLYLELIFLITPGLCSILREFRPAYDYFKIELRY